MNKVGNIILGAGLAGLSAAYHLKETGVDDWWIIEKGERAGGLCRSLNYDPGFTFDQSIHILYSSDPYASGLIKKLLDGNMSVQKREAWVYSNGVYTPYPWQANMYGLPIEVIKECLMGIIQATYERNGRPEPANFEQWCYATFGSGIAKRFMIPYNRKLWAIEPTEMTDAWIKERVMTPDLNEVLEGALHRQEKDFGPNSVFWYPESGGIEALPAGFVRYLDQGRITFNTSVAGILWKEKKIILNDGSALGYENLISSLPLPVIAGMMEPGLPHQQKAASGRLVHNIVYAVNLAVKRERISPYHWVYFPEEEYLLHRISFPANFSPAMAPDGWSSITVEISASKHRKVPVGSELIKSTLSDLKNARIISDSDVIEVKSVLALNPAYIIYNHTHRDDVDSLLMFLRENDIYSCGRFGEWEYLNMDHSILSGKRAVDEMHRAY